MLQSSVQRVKALMIMLQTKTKLARHFEDIDEDVIYFLEKIYYKRDSSRFEPRIRYDVNNYTIIVSWDTPRFALDIAFSGKGIYDAVYTIQKRNTDSKSIEDSQEHDHIEGHNAGRRLLCHFVSFLT